MLSPMLTLGFVPLVLFVWAALAALVARNAKRALPAMAATALWLGLTGALAAFDFFRDFQDLPPRIPLFVAAEMAALVWLLFFSRWRNELTRIPRQQVIALQCFRVPVELLLSALAARSLLPVEMSLHGRNFDILTGLTALPLALWLVRRPTAGRKLVVTWNILGLLLLTNVLVNGMLSAPYPFQKFQFSVDNFLIGYFPVIWLPLFLVPTGYALHFLSLRQEFRAARLEARHA